MLVLEHPVIIFTAAVWLALTMLLLHPLCNFLAYGWKRKQEEVNNSLSVAAKREYLRVFWNQTVRDEPTEINNQFDQQYVRWYGRKRFIAPISIIVFIGACDNLFLAWKLFTLIIDGKPLEGATAATAGAYVFVVYDLFSRVQQRNISTTDILRNALRLALAVPIGYAFASLLQPALAPFISFAVGVFPLSTIGTVLQRLANDKLGLGLGADSADDQVIKLSGIDRQIADRLGDADITTIPQLAWCDPIQLSMRSNLAFDYVVDIVSQALAWVYLTDRLRKIRPLGLRGAYEFKALGDDLASTDVQTKRKAEAVLVAAANAACVAFDGFAYALVQISEDPSTKFLFEASRG
jgi:hypothetical protein